MDTERLPRYVDIRDTSQYVQDWQVQEDINEVQQRYEYTRDFLAQLLICAHCGDKYHVRDNFIRFGCRMHSGTQKYDPYTGVPYYTCCNEPLTTALFKTGCIPCIHSYRQRDFIDVVQSRRGFKKLPIDMVDRMRSIHVNRALIVAVNHHEGKYVFATSQAQLEDMCVLAHPMRDNSEAEWNRFIGGAIISEDTLDDDVDEQGIYPLRELYHDAERIEDDEETLFDQWEQRVAKNAATDNWKLKLLTH